MKNFIRIIIVGFVLSLIIIPNSCVEAEQTTNAENIVAATRLIESNPSGLNYLLRANIYFNGEKYKEAIIDCNQALALGYEDDQVYEIRALSYVNVDKYDEAISDCNVLLERNSQNKSAYRIRGGAYVLKDDYDSALKDYRKALEIDPNDEEIQKAVAGIEEIKAAEESGELTPEAKEQEFFASGIVLFKEKKFTAAIVAFTKALNINPENALTYKMRGAAYIVLNDVDKAIEDWEKALSLNPSDKQTKEFLDKAYSLKESTNK